MLYSCCFGFINKLNLLGNLHRCAKLSGTVPDFFTLKMIKFNSVGSVSVWYICYQNCFHTVSMLHGRSSKIQLKNVYILVQIKVLEKKKDATKQFKILGGLHAW